MIGPIKHDDDAITISRGSSRKGYNSKSSAKLLIFFIVTRNGIAKKDLSEVIYQT